MANLERTLSFYHYFKMIIFFKRYVDDILCIFNGTAEEQQDFFSCINNLNDLSITLPLLRASYEYFFD